MTLLNSAGLAKELGVTPGRVSQYVSGGKLDGCFTGDGRARRFDLSKVAVALGRNLDPGQMLGNGAGTRRALAALPLEDDDEDEAPASSVPVSGKQLDGTALDKGDPSRYELAKIQKAEEETRRLRRQNAEAEGRFVLASEVERQVARLIGQEIAEFEAVLRAGSRRVADRLGVDFKVVRQILVEEWRGHRAGRAEQLVVQADAADLTEAETAESV